MASIDKRSGNYPWRARWREFPGGPQKSKHFAKKSEAQQFLDRIRGDQARGEYVDPNEARRITFSAYTTGWLLNQPWRLSTLESTSSVLQCHLLPMFGERPIGGIRTSELQAWAHGLEEGLAPATVVKAVRLVRAIFQAAVVDRLLGRSPADGIRLRRQEGSMLVPLTVPEVCLLADGAAPPLQDAVRFAASTGLRQGELFGVTEDRIRWLRRELVVDRQLLSPATGPPGFGPCKTARSVRTVPLTPMAIDMLAHSIATFGTGPDGLVFHRGDRAWRRSAAAAAFRRASDGAGVEASGWHALRHHAASIMIAQGLSVTAVAATLGHSPEECLRKYAGWWPSEHEAIRAAIARAWEGAPVQGCVSAEDWLRTERPPAS